MKAFGWTVAAIAAVAMGQTYDDNSITRRQTTDPVPKEATVNNGSADFKVDITATSIFYEDEGETFLRLEFKAKEMAVDGTSMTIRSDKVYEFMLRF